MRTTGSDRRELGARAESLVARYLEARGFCIVARNARVGRKELDIVAARGDLVVFCEVRARTSASFVSPLETIDRAKVRNVRAAAREWLEERGPRGTAVRFDAAAVLFDVPEGRIDVYVEDAF